MKWDVSVLRKAISVFGCRTEAEFDLQAVFLTGVVMSRLFRAGVQGTVAIC